MRAVARLSCQCYYMSRFGWDTQHSENSWCIETLVYVVYPFSCTVYILSVSYIYKCAVCPCIARFAIAATRKARTAYIACEQLIHTYNTENQSSGATIQVFVCLLNMNIHIDTGGEWERILENGMQSWMERKNEYETVDMRTEALLLIFSINIVSFSVWPHQI